MLNLFPTTIPNICNIWLKSHSKPVHPVVQTHQWLSTDEASQKIDILDQLDKPITASHTDFQPKIKKA
jgi:hypothetical protein